MSSTREQSETSAEEQNQEACPVVEAVEEIGSQWRPVVLHDLADSEKRLDELKRSTDACPARQSGRHEPGS